VGLDDDDKENDAQEQNEVKDNGLSFEMDRCDNDGEGTSVDIPPAGDGDGSNESEKAISGTGDSEKESETDEKGLGEENPEAIESEADEKGFGEENSEAIESEAEKENIESGRESERANEEEEERASGSEGSADFDESDFEDDSDGTGDEEEQEKEASSDATSVVSSKMERFPRQKPPIVVHIDLPIIPSRPLRNIFDVGRELSVSLSGVILFGRSEIKSSEATPRVALAGEISHLCEAFPKFLKQVKATRFSKGFKLYKKLEALKARCEQLTVIRNKLKGVVRRYEHHIVVLPSKRRDNIGKSQSEIRAATAALRKAIALMQEKRQQVAELEVERDDIEIELEQRLEGFRNKVPDLVAEKVQEIVGLELWLENEMKEHQSRILKERSAVDSLLMPISGLCARISDLDRRIRESSRPVRLSHGPSLAVRSYVGRRFAYVT
jgi:hypothetical protein